MPIAKQDSYSSGKTWETWEKGLFEKIRENLENSGNFILPNISDQIVGALRINEASTSTNGTYSLSTIISLFVKLLYLAP